MFTKISGMLIEIFSYLLPKYFFKQGNEKLIIAKKIFLQKVFIFFDIGTIKIFISLGQIKSIQLRLNCVRFCFNHSKCIKKVLNNRNM